MPATTIQLSYGTTGLTLSLDADAFDVCCLEPHSPPPCPAPQRAFAAAVAAPIAGPPLAELGRRVGAGRVTIVVADHTRPVPDRLLVPWLVETLGVRDEQVTILVGTGTHRASTPEELLRMLGPACRQRFSVRMHDCQDEGSLVKLGVTADGGECWLNRHYVEADLRLATGFVEPHFFAGFSGGPKALVPGIAGFRTIQHFHRASLIADPLATWSLLTENPMQQLARRLAGMGPPHFIVNVTLNLRQEITAVFAGEMIAAHEAACREARRHATVAVPRPFPVVVTTNSGYPLDQNFYQTVKGITAAAQIVAENGVIVVASECRNGLPREGEFGRLLARPQASADLLTDLLATPGPRTVHDQWQVQKLLQIQQRARILLYSGLSPEDRVLTRVECIDDLGAALAELRRAAGGVRLPVAVLPRGPLTIPTLAPAAGSHTD